jgi:DNA-binding MarR family transcriptional regulator
MERASIRRLRQELQQGKPFRSTGHAAALALLRTVDELRRRHDHIVAGRGISMEQYNVLRILRGAAGTPMPVLEIASRLLERNPGITRLLDKLDAKGLIERDRCENDRRQVLSAITRPGQTLLAALDGPVEQLTRESFGSLPESELNKLIDILDHIRHPKSKKDKHQ